MNQEFEELLSTIPQDQNLLRGVEEATKQGAVLPNPKTIRMGLL